MATGVVSAGRQYGLVTWASMPALLRTAVVSARMVRLTPHRRARGQSGDRKLVAARWVPTSEDEHAVSMLTLGPCQASLQAQCLSQNHRKVQPYA